MGEFWIGLGGGELIQHHVAMAHDNFIESKGTKYSYIDL